MKCPDDLCPDATSAVPSSAVSMMMSPSLTRVALLAVACISRATATNTVVFADVRVTVHTSRMLRLEWSANSTFEDRPSLLWSNRHVSVPFEHKETQDSLVLTTSDVVLEYNVKAGNHNSEPTRLSADPPLRFGTGILRVSFNNGAQQTSWSPSDQAAQAQSCRLFGQDRKPCGGDDATEDECAALGCCWRDIVATHKRREVMSCFHPASIGAGNLNGSNDVFDCDAGSLVCTPWYANREGQGLVSREGWSVIDDTGGPLIDVNNKWRGEGGWLVPRKYTAEYRECVATPQLLL